MAGAETARLVISALCGALGALLLRSTLKVALALRARSTPLAVYDCAVSGTKPGEFGHCYGHEVGDEASTNGKAWEHDWHKVPATPPRQAIGEHTIYGPYINDFGRPGFFRVSFRIQGKGLPKTDEPVISLDVVQAAFGTERVLRLIGQRVIRARELSDSYQYFDIVCYASGTDIYEYRCAVLPDADATRKGTCTIRFDCIKIYAHPPIWESL